MLRQSTGKSLHTFSTSFTVILRPTVAELNDSVCRLDRFYGFFDQYSVTFCHMPEVASDVLTGSFVRQIVLHGGVIFDDPRLDRSTQNLYKCNFTHLSLQLLARSTW